MNILPKNSSGKRVYYSRVSTAGQSDERQLQNLKGYDYILRDKCSGLISFFERPGGKQIKKLANNNELKELVVHSIDRLGRNTIDVLTIWKQLTDQHITIICKNPSLRNFNHKGEPDKISEMILTILATMSSYEKSLIKERQMEGIAIRKAKGLYTGRAINTKESPEKFLNKPKNKKIIEKLSAGYTQAEISKILGCSYSTIAKVIKISIEK